MFIFDSNQSTRKAVAMSKTKKPRSLSEAQAIAKFVDPKFAGIVAHVLEDAEDKTIRRVEKISKHEVRYKKLSLEGALLTDVKYRIAERSGEETLKRIQKEDSRHDKFMANMYQAILPSK